MQNTKSHRLSGGFFILCGAIAAFVSAYGWKPLFIYSHGSMKWRRIPAIPHA